VDDPFDLERFVQAQQAVYAAVCAELRVGAKRSHWMWFIFPQLRGLGSSPSAQHYGLASLAEARAYLDHPVLGARLRECTRRLLVLEGRSAAEIFGYPDDLKLRSCLTLFERASPQEQLFSEALRKYYRGKPDLRTLELLRSSACGTSG
jgi:uncharacterized protein (DUF1810 family)